METNNPSQQPTPPLGRPITLDADAQPDFKPRVERAETIVTDSHATRLTPPDAQPQRPTPPAAKPQKKGGVPFWLVGTLIFLLAAVLGGAAYYFFFIEKIL